MRNKSSVRTVLAIFVIVFVSSLAVHYGSQHRQLSQSPTLAPTPPPAMGSVLTEKHNEPFYTQQIARQFAWEAEVKTSIGTRCDLVSEQYCIEVEWPRKPYEAVGQSLHYSVELGKPPAILFLLSDQQRYEREYAVERIGEVAAKYGIVILWYDTQTERLTER